MKINDKHLALLCQDQHCDRAGYMFKRGVFFNTEFKKRWFVLKGNLLFYFKSKSSLSDPTGVIFLEDAVVEVNDIVSQPHFYYEFTIKFPGGEDARSYHLATKTKESTDEWTAAIRNAGFYDLKEKLDALQMQLFKAEFCFGIEQARDEDGDAAPAPVAQSPLPPDQDRNQSLGRESVQAELEDSSDDDLHYQSASSMTPFSPQYGSPEVESSSRRSTKSSATDVSSRFGSAISFRTMLDAKGELDVSGAGASPETPELSTPPEPPSRKKELQNPAGSSSVLAAPSSPTPLSASAKPVPPTRDPYRIAKTDPNSVVSSFVPSASGGD